MPIPPMPSSLFTLLLAASARGARFDVRPGFGGMVWIRGGVGSSGAGLCEELDMEEGEEEWLSWTRGVGYAAAAVRRRRSKRGRGGRRWSSAVRAHDDGERRENGNPKLLSLSVVCALSVGFVESFRGLYLVRCCGRAGCWV